MSIFGLIEENMELSYIHLAVSTSENTYECSQNQSELTGRYVLIARLKIIWH